MGGGASRVRVPARGPRRRVCVIGSLGFSKQPGGQSRSADGVRVTDSGPDPVSNFKRTLRIAICDMGGVLGRPRRGLPDNPRYLPPGRYVRDVRDGDVLVLCSADAPLNLTVVPGRHPDDDGAWLGTSNERGENDPEYALVRGAPRAPAAWSGAWWWTCEDAGRRFDRPRRGIGTSSSTSSREPATSSVSRARGDEEARRHPREGIATSWDCASASGAARDDPRAGGSST